MQSKLSVPLWRSRWAAIGAAVAVTIGGGGLYAAHAGSGSSVFVPVTPTRVLDTRLDIGLAGTFTTDIARLLDVAGPIAIAPSGTATIVPDGATAVVLNVTVVSPTASGYLSIRPGNAVGAPSTSSLNFNAGDVIPNGVAVELNTTGGGVGMINIFFHGNAVGSTTHILIDIVGYYGPTNIAGPPGPINRISNQQIGMLRWDQDPGRAATVTVGVIPQAVGFDGSNIWVTNYGSGTVSKINPTTNTVTATVTVEGSPRGIAFDGSNIWVATASTNSVKKINPTTNAVTATVTVGTNPWGIAFDGTSMWVTNAGDGTVSIVNATTNAVSSPVTVGDGPRGIAFDGSNIWVATSNTITVKKINPTTNAITAVTVGANPWGIAFDGTSLWVVKKNVLGSVIKINPDTEAACCEVNIGRSPFGIAFDGSNIWISNGADSTVTKLIPF